MTSNFVYPRNAFLGFDHIFDQLESIHSHAKDTYPPHNVIKHDTMKYEIELAVAGFNKDHIDIEIKDHVLTPTCSLSQVIDRRGVIKIVTFIKGLVLEGLRSRIV